jgi:hypothetical protein
MNGYGQLRRFAGRRKIYLNLAAALTVIHPSSLDQPRPAPRIGGRPPDGPPTPLTIIRRAP